MQKLFNNSTKTNTFIGPFEKPLIILPAIKSGIGAV